MNSENLIAFTGSTYDPIALLRFGNSVEGSTAPKACRIYKIDEHRVQTIDIPVNHSSIDLLVESWNRNAIRKEAMQRARKWLSENFHSDNGKTVKTIRLNKGISQSQLASTIGTSQPHIARIEKGTENVGIETCRKLCAALQIDMNTLDAALQKQENILANKVAK